MKKTTFFGLGLILIGIFATFYHSEQPVLSFFSSETEEVNETQVMDAKNIKSIKIKTSSPDVSLIGTDSDEITVELKGQISSKLKDSLKLDVSTNNDKLTVSLKRSDKNVTTLFGIVIFDVDLEVYVPQKMYELISITTSSGEISVADFQAEGFEFKASSGDIEISNITAEKEIDLTSSSGEIELVNSQTKELDAKASSGSITIDRLISEEINVGTSSGEIQLSETEGEITAAASSGSITIDNERLNGDITVATSSGDVEIDFFDTPTSVIVDFKASSGKGSVNIPGISFDEKLKNSVEGKVGSGEFEIKVRTSSGDFELN